MLDSHDTRNALDAFNELEAKEKEIRNTKTTSFRLPGMYAEYSVLKEKLVKYQNKCGESGHRFYGGCEGNPVCTCCKKSLFPKGKVQNVK